MPSSVALLLCMGVGLVLLRIERESMRIGRVSFSSWIPALWMMASAAKPLANWFGSESPAGGVEAGSPLDRNLATGLIFAGLLVVSQRRLDWRAIARNNSALLVIYLFALVSLLWSDFLFVSIKRYIRFSGAVVMALVILSERNPRQAFESVLRKTAFILIPFSLLLIKYFPHFGVAYGRWSGELMWVGMADQKNSFGILCFVCSFFLFWRILRAWPQRKLTGIRKQLYADSFVFVIALYLLKGPPVGYSATSISVFILGVGVFLGLFWLHRRRQQAGLFAMTSFVTLLFLYGWGAPFGARNLGSSILKLLGRDPSFTDRDVIWKEVISVWAQSPVLGHGYGGAWIKAIAEVNSPHNGYLGIMLELGLIGVLLVFAFVLSMCHAAWATSRRDFWWGALAFCFLSMVVLHNISEASLLRTSDFLWSLLLCLSVLIRIAPRYEPISDRKQRNQRNVSGQHSVSETVQPGTQTSFAHAGNRNC